MLNAAVRLLSWGEFFGRPYTVRGILALICVPTAFSVYSYGAENK